MVLHNFKTKFHQYNNIPLHSSYSQFNNQVSFLNPNFTRFATNNNFHSLSSFIIILNINTKLEIHQGIFQDHSDNTILFTQLTNKISKFTITYGSSQSKIKTSKFLKYIYMFSFPKIKSKQNFVNN